VPIPQESLALLDQLNEVPVNTPCLDRDGRQRCDDGNGRDGRDD
jgi:hypothetical protein